MPARSPSVLSNWLDRDPALRQLARQVDDLVALQRLLREAGNGAPVSVSAIADGTITVTVPGAAWATRLRQIEPSLVAALAREGVPVRRLRIRPRRQVPPAVPVVAPKRPPPGEALAALASLRATATSPVLQEALGRMLARHASHDRPVRPEVAPR